MPAEVVVSKSFRGYADVLDRRIERALGKAAQVGVAVARSTPSRYQIQEILGSVEATPARRWRVKGVDGIEVSIVAKDWRSVFYELGTYTRRRRKLKQPRRSSRANKGVRAGYFLNRGKKAAQAALPGLLAREVGSVR